MKLEKSGLSDILLSGARFELKERSVMIYQSSREDIRKIRNTEW